MRFVHHNVTSATKICCLSPRDESGQNQPLFHGSRLLHPLSLCAPGHYAAINLSISVAYTDAIVVHVLPTNASMPVQRPEGATTGSTKGVAGDSMTPDTSSKHFSTSTSGHSNMRESCPLS